MNNRQQSDALVLFGATGDLACKKTFPALMVLLESGQLDLPVIGVGRSPWRRDQLLERVRNSLNDYGGGANAAAFNRLAERLDSVSGYYADEATYSRLKKKRGGAVSATHYLAIPPFLFGIVVQQLGRAGLARNARVVIEKPFGNNR